MKKFILSEITLLSTIEKKAKMVEFDPSRTIILGKNETGKSSLIKSIYQTFGATPAKENSKWKRTSVISFVKFLVDDVAYSILKDGKFFHLFDSEDQLVGTWDSVTKGLGPALANLFDFKIKLSDREGNSITPPPAFLFLPFYVDQDAGWKEPWKSFNYLSQIKAYKVPIIEYHTGLRGNEYYETKGEVQKINDTIEELEQERKLSNSILKKINEKFNEIDFAIDINEFKAEIDRLLEECQKLKQERDAKKEVLVGLYNAKIAIETQINITKQALNETRKDYSFALLDVENQIDCPTCGAHYENSFLERFEIAQDENRCKELMVSLSHELAQLDQQIQKEQGKFTEKSEELLRIESLLEEKKGQVKLKDIIENEGKKELKSIFNDSIQEIQTSIVENAIEQKRLKDKLSALEDKNKKEAIRTKYRSLMKRFLRHLDVNLNESDYNDLTKNISNTGSALPRSLAAYYFSILEIIKDYSSSAYCPIIIDSPNQQAQDYENVAKMLTFIKENQPRDTQMILGLEELHGIDFECRIVELKHKHSLLLEDEYDIAQVKLAPYLNKIWSGGGLFH